MSTDLSARPEEHRRKQVRKGTKSCWECKRRKVKCIYRPDDPSVCTECLARATSCLSQAYAENQSPQDAGISALGMRMERLEAVLEKLVDSPSRMLHSDDSPRGTASIPRMLSTPSTTPNSRHPLPTPVDNLGGQYAEVDIPTPTVNMPSVMSPMMPPHTGDAGLEARIESLRQQLTSLLPSQRVVDQLQDSSQGWWLIQRHMLPYLHKTLVSDFRKGFDVTFVSRSHPVVIGRLLLIIAICIQQLPPNSATSIQTTMPLQEMMEKNVSMTSDLITSDDDLTGKLEGIECLLLQGLYHTNAGNLRRSLLAFRRAINVAHFMGLHRTQHKSLSEVPNITETKRYRCWQQLLRGERYLSLILGIPSATGTVSFHFDDNICWLSTEEIYHQHLCNISGSILARNQDDPSHFLSATYDIDGKLDMVARKMPQAWWQIPPDINDDRTDETSSRFERVMCQVWHYELRILLHLPFMLCVSADRRYEYSRVSCLDACRGLIQRWIFIRGRKSSTLFSNLVEFQAFTSVITLLLAHLQHEHTTPKPAAIVQEQSNDLQLAENVVQILERLKSSGAGVQIVNQSISAIRRLQGVLQHGQGWSGNLHFEIPHFGTVNIARSGVVQSAEGGRMLNVNRQLEISREASSLPQARMSAWQRPVDNLEPPWTFASAAASHGYQNTNGATYDNGIDDNMARQNTILQFWSCQFPNLDLPPQESITLDWWSGENEVNLDNLLSSDMEWSCDL